MRKHNTSPEYAIVDIETTGGYPSGCGITEVAILIYDGQQVVDRYVSLVNPCQPIPLAIQMMTGITNEMVIESPVFDDVAPQIHAFLSNRIFVAHNVNFDYSFLKHHLAAAGYFLDLPRLCTVRMSRKLYPGLPSYSLGKLCNTLGIPLRDRHRALGDADATAILFDRLLQVDNKGVVADMLKKTSKHQQLPPNLPREEFEALPHRAGVYYFHDKGGKVIYVGKARDIRKRVAQHFTGHNAQPQRQHFLRDIYAISCTPCGTELMALLLEAAEIQRLWPIHNRALKRFEAKFALYTYEDNLGYLRLAIGRHHKYQQQVRVFHRKVDGYNLLRRLVTEFGLHPAYCGLGQLGVKIGPSDHNLRVRKALDYLANELPTFAIFDKGRDDSETSCIWVEQGEFYGMGHLSLEANLTSPDHVKGALSRYPSTHYMMQLIYNFAEKYPDKVWKQAE